MTTTPTVGYFFYERGLLGPCPVKVDADMHRFRLAQPEHAERMVSRAVPLTAELWGRGIDTLARHFPPPVTA